jgi:TPR repeat protein
MKMTKKEAYEKFYDAQELFYGKGRRKNHKKAFGLLMMAAKHGIPHAQNLVGYCFSEGLGVDKDSKEGFTWYRKAALNKRQSESSKENRAIAFCNLAMMYDQGDGVAENPKLAFKYYKKAAELGDVMAQCNFAILYHEGRGIRKDDKNAIYWCRKAARRGDDKAQHNLGLAYLEGDGVRQSRKHAKVWFKKAAAKGHKEAKKELKNL